MVDDFLKNFKILYMPSPVRLGDLNFIFSIVPKHSCMTKICSFADLLTNHIIQDVSDSRKQTNHPYLKLTGPTCQHNIPGQNFWPLTFKGIQTIDITTFHLSHQSASGVPYFGHQEYQLYRLEGKPVRRPGKKLSVENK